jgi:ABC-2 type transport system permease protein
VRNVLSIARRIITQIGMDTRTLFLITCVPPAIVALMWVVINGGLSRPTLALAGDPPSLFLGALAKNAEVVAVDSTPAGLDLVGNQKADAFLDYSIKPPKLTIDGADPSVTAAVLQAIQKTAVSFMSTVPVLKGMMGNIQPKVELLHGSMDGSPFDFLAPVMLGFVIFFFIFILSAISFLRERTTGTLSRILATPATPLELVAGYMLGFGFFAALETLVIQLFTIWVLGIPAVAPFVDILVVNLALCLVALAMGCFVSAFARNEFQVLQFIPIVIVPQILFAGILDLRQSPAWVRLLSYLFPLTYGGDALRQMMLRGRTLGDVWLDLAIVLGFAALFVALNALSIRKART